MPLGFNGGIRVDGLLPGALTISAAKMSNKIIYSVPKDFLICVDEGDKICSDDYIAVHADGSVFVSGVNGTVDLISSNRVLISTSNESIPELYPIAQDIRRLEKNEIIDHIRLSGVFSESGIPLWRMIKPLMGKCETLIINGAETNPGVTSKHAVLRAYPEKVIGGIKIMMRCLSMAKAILVLTEHMQTEAGAIREKLEQKKLIDIYGIASKYPCENDRVMFAALTGCTTEPSSKNALILSVHDCVRVFDLFTYGRCQPTKTITVNNKNYNVHIGTPINSVAESCSLKLSHDATVYVGGAFGSYSADEWEAIHEGSTGVFYSENTGIPMSLECIGCGKCHIHCPIGLMPKRILEAIVQGNQRKLTWYQLGACIGCGTCSAVCPSYLEPHVKISAYLRGERSTENIPVTNNEISDDAVVSDFIEPVDSIPSATDEIEEIGSIESEDSTAKEQTLDDMNVIGTIEEIEGEDNQ